MKIRHAAWTVFRLPFKAPFAAAHGTLTARDGLLLRLTSADGVQGLGEASPLPTLGGGSRADALAIIAALGPRLIGLEVREAGALLREIDLAAPGGAAAACALDTALGDLAARAAGISLAELLGGAPADADAVAVNATVGAAGTDEAVQAAAAAVAAGFTCIKLKVGLDHRPGADVRRVRRVREAIGPRVRLRLDANGAWQAAAAIAVLRRLEGEGCDLEMVEQPVPAGDLAGMAAVRRAVRTPIAADEGVGTVEDARRVIAAEAADLLVVKPMTAGGPRAGRAIAEVARAAGLGVVVTSTLDAGVGVAAALHLAATLPAPRAACGLATGGLLAGDLLAAPLPVRDGAMRLPAGAGLGVALDDRALARFGGAWCRAGAGP